MLSEVSPKGFFESLDESVEHQFKVEVGWTFHADSQNQPTNIVGTGACTRGLCCLVPVSFMGNCVGVGLRLTKGLAWFRFWYALQHSELSGLRKSQCERRYTCQWTRAVLGSSRPSCCAYENLTKGPRRCHNWYSRFHSLYIYIVFIIVLVFVTDSVCLIYYILLIWKIYVCVFFISLILCLDQ